MLKPTDIARIKQTNVSKDADSTKSALSATWKAAEKTKRNEILALSGVKKPSIERAYKSGNVSAKIVVAMAQVLQIDPVWLAGNSAEARPFEQKQVLTFLAELGYTDKKAKGATGKKPAKKPVRKTAKKASIKPGRKPAAPKTPAATPAKPPAKAPRTTRAASTANVSEEQLVLLLRGLSIQAEFSPEKKATLATVTSLLLA
jgi:hypothetical protein